MKTSCILSVSILGIFMLLLFIDFLANTIGLANPIFDTTYDQSPYIGTARAFIRFLDATQQINFVAVVFSAITSVFTCLKNKKMGKLQYTNKG